MPEQAAMRGSTAFRPHSEVTGSVAHLRSRIEAYRRTLPPADANRLLVVLLFGSRARGDHRPDSDWDVCALWDGAPPNGKPIREHEGAPVDWWNLDAGAFKRDASRAGTLPRSAARFGVALHGEVPAGDATEVPMNHKDWSERFSAIFATTRQVLEEAYACRDDMETPWEAILSGSADLAEYVVKLALTLKCIEPKWFHDVEALANQWPDQGESYAARMRELNGDTDDSHAIDYGGIDDRYGPSDNLHALRRTEGALSLLLDVLEDPRLGGEGIAKDDDMSDTEWERAAHRARRSEERWNSEVIDLLRKLHAADMEEPLFASMLDSAARVGAWAKSMADRVERYRDQTESASGQPGSDP